MEILRGTPSIIRDLNRLAEDRFDVLVIGGGILGAGIARDAALRGLSVALVDQGDFAGGTSSRSSKLVHGGLRYLEHGSFGLVREACAERATLLRIAPHLVRPLPLLFPCRRGRGRPLWKVRAGLAIYDFLTAGQTPGHRRHRMIFPPDIRRLEPELDTKDLEGAGLYFDCQMNDARLCVETLLSAMDGGAAAANYVRVTAVRKTGGNIDGACLLDLETGREFAVRAKILVNAAGPWADRIRVLDDPQARPIVRTTKGIHLVTRRLTQAGIAATARSDGRLFFILPFEDRHSIIGTTDTDSGEDPAEPAVERRDAEYLLSETNAVLPAARLSEGDVCGVFAGLRTLIRAPGDPENLSREYLIEESSSGMISIVGGKYTTFRSTAERVVDRVLGRLSLRRACATGVQPLPDRRAGRVPGTLREEADHAIASEMARRPMDVLRRRTSFALTHPPDMETTRDLADLFQKRLGWPGGTKEKMVEETFKDWQTCHSID